MAKDQTVLFHSCVFGPIRSRRLGVSLGINLSPDDGKVCTFDCLYCEAGYNAQGTGTTGLPGREVVAQALRSKLEAMRDASETLDVITFSGNGEPTMHPEFAGIVDDTLALRDEFFPQAAVSVLSNSTCLNRPDVAAALRKVDNNILKLDSAVESTMRLIDRPVAKSFTVEKVLPLLSEFAGQCVVQTMMLRGAHNGQLVDNTTPEEIEALCRAYKAIRPRSIMLYSIDRSTPEENLVKVPAEELRAIGSRIAEATGLPVQVN